MTKLTALNIVAERARSCHEDVTLHPLVRQACPKIILAIAGPFAALYDVFDNASDIALKSVFTATYVVIGFIPFNGKNIWSQVDDKYKFPAYLNHLKNIGLCFIAVFAVPVYGAYDPKDCAERIFAKSLIKIPPKQMTADVFAPPPPPPPMPQNWRLKNEPKSSEPQKTASEVEFEKHCGLFRSLKEKTLDFFNRNKPNDLDKFVFSVDSLEEPEREQFISYRKFVKGPSDQTKITDKIIDHFGNSNFFKAKGWEAITDNTLCQFYWSEKIDEEFEAEDSDSDSEIDVMSNTVAPQSQHTATVNRTVNQVALRTTHKAALGENLAAQIEKARERLIKGITVEKTFDFSLPDVEKPSKMQSAIDRMRQEAEQAEEPPTQEELDEWGCDEDVGNKSKDSSRKIDKGCTVFVEGFKDLSRPPNAVKPTLEKLPEEPFTEIVAYGRKQKPQWLKWKAACAVIERRNNQKTKAYEDAIAEIDKYNKAALEYEERKMSNQTGA